MILMSMQCYLPLQAQDKGDERVTLMAGDVTLASVLKNIEKQTHKRFNYSENELNTREKIHVSYSDAPLHQVLGQLFTAKGISWKVIDNGIYLRKEDMPVKQPAPADSNNISVISGVVTDETGVPLPGATIIIKGTNVGTSADLNGRFQLTNSSSGTILRISFTSFETREISIKEKRSLNVMLKRVVGKLDETVVIGYGTTTKRFNTGAISTVKSDVIESQPVTNPLQALEGRIPGLYISQASGIPGAGVVVKLRGQNSIVNGNDPLYIIDGVPYSSSSPISPNLGGGPLGTQTQNQPGGGLSPFNLLSPSDIERIDVLKDADATAIYGSRGANGVILITTKKGKAGKTKFDFNISTGAGKVTNMLSLLNTKQYLAMRREALTNDGKTAGPADYDINGTWDTTRYTDWQKLLIGGTAKLTNAQAAISGGNDNTQFSVRGAYSRQTTVYPGDFSDKKASASFSLTHSSTNGKFHSNLNGSYLNNINNLPMFDATSSTLIAPDAPPLYDATGNLNWANNTFINPLTYTKRTVDFTADNLIGNLSLSYEIIPGLSLKTSLGYNYITTSQTHRIGSNSLPSYMANDPNSRKNNFANTSIKNWIAEPQINYDKRINNNHISVLIGSTFQQNSNLVNSFLASGYTSDALIGNPGAAANIRALTSVNSLYKYNAIFGRLNYTYDDKYIINLSARRDGSSRFGPGRQFGNFGSVGVAWIFSEERWIRENIPSLSFGKLRASYGTAGNDQISDYKFYSTYSTDYNNYMGVSGLMPTNAPNSNFQWELNRKIELGLETGLFNNRVQLNLDYYRNRSGNQLLAYALPSTTGFYSVLFNLPAIVQNTGIELDITSDNINLNGFNWKTSVNISIPRNKLVSYPNLEASSYKNSFVIGRSILGRKSYQYTGVDPVTGIYTVLDANNDNIYDPKDYIKFGETTQRYFGGLLNTFSYKSLECDVFLQFTKQSGFDYVSKLFIVPGSYNTNIPVELLNNVWHNKGDRALYQKLSTGDANTNRGLNYRSNSDAYVTDASFIRLKNISISYVLPRRWLQRMQIQNVKLYLQGENLLTFTHYKWLDPEITAGYALPPLKMVVGGIQISL